jgi:hypothetical protein
LGLGIPVDLALLEYLAGLAVLLFLEDQGAHWDHRVLWLLCLLFHQPALRVLTVQVDLFVRDYLECQGFPYHR